MTLAKDQWILHFIPASIGHTHWNGVPTCKSNKI
nr:MAG TPA: hypothetical protein [Caudoviricetes sp.]